MGLGDNMANKYETKLTKEEEKSFNEWFKQAKENGIINENDNGNDYDFRGFWKDIVNNPQNKTNYSQETHFPDTYKKPNHETFSIESKYAKGAMKKYAGYWDGDTYISPEKKYKNRDAADILYE